MCGVIVTTASIATIVAGANANLAELAAGDESFPSSQAGQRERLSKLTVTESRRGRHQALDRRCEVTAPIFLLHHRPHTMAVGS